MTNTLRRALLSLCALVALSAVPAYGTTTTWTFTGTCSDCPGVGVGTLTAEYNTLSQRTLFQFNYVSDWITYTLSGPVLSLNEGGYDHGPNFTIAPGDSVYILQAQVTIQSFGGPGNPLPAGFSTPDQTYFSLAGNGTWITGGNTLLDFGTNGGFTLQPSGVPEPSTLALTGLGALVLGFYRRRRTC